ncbi:MAG: hypothetical protein ACJA0H_001957 [Francisellaceae bacterium]
MSMGEYFDHAYYGIAHTKEGMRRKIPVLTSNPASKLSYYDKEVPVFIVGNGPSLDSSIEAIKEWQGQAIVVSCGTALQALHRHGITPDFHAEIEQNRSTFDWAVLIGDLDYLKNITLISCNGIHPDTCDLYKDVMIAFKEGESSTVSALNVLGRKNFETLLNAFPTVSNFAIDLFSTIGFTSIYLIGVDLGFVDVKHHHSKSSGYYQENGEETYDFTKSANTSLIVPGNFRPKVNTKHEFKVSRQDIEQVTGAKPKEQEFYNCSDGAKIQGALPLRLDELLIVVTANQKTQIVKKLKTLIFSTKQLVNYVEKFEKHYSQDLLIEELNAFETLLEKDVTSKEDVESIINKQKEMLFASYKKGNSLLFYYLYGTVNYANAVLTKLSCNIDQSCEAMVIVKDAIAGWKKTVARLNEFLMISKNIQYFETSGFKMWERELAILPKKTAGISMLTISNRKAFTNCMTWNRVNHFPFFCNFQTTKNLENSALAKKYDFVIYDENETNLTLSGSINTMYITHSNDVSIISQKKGLYLSIPDINNTSTINNIRSLTFTAIRACLIKKMTAFIIPKLATCDSYKFSNAVMYKIPMGFIALDFFHFIFICATEEAGVVYDISGTRGRLIFGDVKMQHLQLGTLTKEFFDDIIKRDKKIASLGAQVT